MKNKKYYWKVVRVMEKGKMVSAISYDDQESITYTVGKWIYPIKGCNPFIFIFKNREYARKFIRTEKVFDKRAAFKIFKVEVKNVETDKLDIFNCKFSNSFCPKGTLFCDSLMIVQDA